VRDRRSTPSTDLKLIIIIQTIFTIIWTPDIGSYLGSKKLSNIHNKCKKHQFIHLLTATLKNSHIKNNKNHKKWYCPHHTDCVSMCCLIISVSPGRWS